MHDGVTLRLEEGGSGESEQSVEASSSQSSAAEGSSEWDDSTGIYMSGSYYEYVKEVITQSLNNYLSDTFTDTSACEEYVNSLGTWATFDTETNQASVLSIRGFIQSQKVPTKEVGAFDALYRNQTENEVFSDSDNNPLHFDAIMAHVLETGDREGTYASYSDYDNSVSSDYATDLIIADTQHNNVTERGNMYTPTQ